MHEVGPFVEQWTLLDALADVINHW